MMKALKYALSVVFLGLTGCSTITHDAVFSEEQRLVREITGYEIEYSDADREIDSRVKDYLAGGLTLDEAVRVALLNNQGLQGTFEKLGVARGELIDAGLLRNPVFEAEIHFEGGGIGKGTNLNLIEELISVVQLPLRKQIAASRLEAAKYEVASEVLALIYDTKSAYYALQTAQSVYALERQNVEAFEAAAEISRRQREAGNVTSRELTSNLLVFAKARRDLAATEQELVVLRERLGLLLGLWSLPWTIAPEPITLRPEIPDAQALEQIALTRRPELLRSRHEIEALANELGVAEGFRLLPELSVGVDVEGEDGSRVVPGPNLSLPIPIFNQGQGQIVQGQSKLRMAQRQYAAQAIQIRSEVRTTLQKLVSAVELSRFDEKHLAPLSTEAVRTTQQEYNAMLTGVFELLRSKQDELDAAKVRAEGLRDYALAEVELERAVGGVISPLHADERTTERGN